MFFSNGTPIPCKRIVSGSISPASPAYFSPFPHGTGSLSVRKKYLALAHSRAGFPRDFTSPVVLKYDHSKAITPFAYGTVTLFGSAFQRILLGKLRFVDLTSPSRQRS